MRHKYMHRGTYISVLFLIFFSLNMYAQVGIGNIDPAESSFLEIGDGNSNTKGLLIPRVSIPDLALKAPITTTTIGESLLVYNMNSTTGKGFYYWNGTRWIGIDGGKNWSLTGNAGTTHGTTPLTNFIGTTDNVHFQVRTNRFARFDFTSNGRLRSYDNGSSSEPTYSWNGADYGQNMGMYRIGQSILGFSTAGTERMRIAPNGNVGIGSANAREKLEVTGNLRLSGAFMPNGQTGTTGRVLTSAGSAAPTWGAEMVNINQIRRFITTPLNINANTINSITVPVPGLTNQGTAIVNLSGDWTTHVNDEITIHHIEVRTGEVRFVVTNNTGGFFGGGVNYPGMDFTITIIR